MGTGIVLPVSVKLELEKKKSVTVFSHRVTTASNTILGVSKQLEGRTLDVLPQGNGKCFG